MSALLLIEDDRSLGQEIVNGLVAQGHQVAWERDGLAGLKRALAEAPELVILDVMLPTMDGFAVLSRLRDHSAVPVLLLTARTETEDKIRGFDLGADDYLTKPFWMEELQARVRARLRRPELGPSETRLRFGAVELDPELRRIWIAGEVCEFTRAEFDLLLYLLKRPGRAVTREQLLEAALEPEREGGYRTLDTHFSRIRKKLGRNARFLKTVWGIGYRFDPEAE